MSPNGRTPSPTASVRTATPAAIATIRRSACALRRATARLSALVAADAGRIYVTDRVQGALLILDDAPELELQRRVYLPGGPSAVSVAGDRVVVSLADAGEVVELSADGAARLLLRRRAR